MKEYIHKIWHVQLNKGNIFTKMRKILKDYNLF